LSSVELRRRALRPKLSWVVSL